MGPSIAVGLQINTQPPLAASRAVVLAVRAMGLESVMLIDHFQNVFPRNRGGSHESSVVSRTAPLTSGMRVGQRQHRRTTARHRHRNGVPRRSSALRAAFWPPRVGLPRSR